MNNEARLYCNRPLAYIHPIRGGRYIEYTLCISALSQQTAAVRGCRDTDFYFIM